MLFAFYHQFFLWFTAIRATFMSQCSFVLVDSQRQCMQWSAIINKAQNKIPITYSNLNNNQPQPSKIHYTNKLHNQWFKSVHSPLKINFLYCFCSWFFFLNSEALLVSFCLCFLFLFLGSIWQLHFFTLLISSLFPDDPLFFSSSFPLLSVRKGSPARVFVWWWDRLCRFHPFFILCLSLLLSESFSPSSPPPLLFSVSFVFCFYFLFGRDAWGIVYDSFRLVLFVLDFPASSSISASPSAISVT